jgi:membrane peptidoglycan carboxypeptidase
MGLPTRTYGTSAWTRAISATSPSQECPSAFPSAVWRYTRRSIATLQRAAERAVRSGLDRLAMRGVEASLVAIDPRNGEVLAMVGGREYGASQFNRATAALRQPGSAFKPVVALAALERWEGRDPAFTLASVLDDEPLRLRTRQGPWEPS